MLLVDGQLRKNKPTNWICCSSCSSPLLKIKFIINKNLIVTQGESKIYIKLVLITLCSNSIHQGLETSSLKKAISELLSMKTLLDNLHGTSCQHLNKFLVDTLKHWNKIVVDKLSK